MLTIFWQDKLVIKLSLSCHYDYKTEQGELINDNKQIVDYIKEFHESLYTATYSETNIPNNSTYVENTHNLKTLDPTQIQLCEGLLTTKNA